MTNKTRNTIFSMGLVLFGIGVSVVVMSVVAKVLQGVLNIFIGPNGF